MTSVLHSDFKNCSELSQSLQNEGIRRFWKDQKQILRNGLIKCDNRQKSFYAYQCVNLIQDLLWIYQQKGLKLHYANLKNIKDGQKITFKCYVDMRLLCCQRQQPKKWQIDQFYIHYKILRISQATSGTVACKYPYLLLFSAQSNRNNCKNCNITPIFNIAHSSFYAIRSQFVREIVNKIAFMDRYPRYSFKPYDFASKEPIGQTIYESVDNCQRSYYSDRCEIKISKFLQLQMIKRQMDCQVVSLNILCQGDHKLVDEYKNAMNWSAFQLQLKYICKECTRNNFWKARDKVFIHYSIQKLKKSHKERLQAINAEDQKFVFEGSDVQAKYRQFFQSKETAQEEESKEKLEQFFKIPKAALDMSLKKEQHNVQTFQKALKGCFAFHENLECYNWPYLVVFSVNVPTDKCPSCGQEKDGLIYTSDLISKATNTFNQNIIRKINAMHAKAIDPSRKWE